MADVEENKPEELGAAQEEKITQPEPEPEPEKNGEEKRHEDEGSPEDNENVEQEEEEGEEEEKVEEGKGKKSKRATKGSEKKKASKEKKDAVVTPSSDRPTRERKVVERYVVPEPVKNVTKPLFIEKGRGTQLKEIPNVAFKLSKKKADDNLQLFHTILFGKKAKVHLLKRNIGQFSGFVWTENEEKQKAKVKERIDKCFKEKLIDFCDLLNIPINKSALKKEELTVKILEFLESPRATTDILLSEKEQEGKKRKSTPSKSAGRGELSVTPAKKQKKTSQSGKKQKTPPENEEDVEEDKVESQEAKDESEEDDKPDSEPKEGSDHEESDADEEDDVKEQKSAQKSLSKKTAKGSSGVKSKEKPTPGKKKSTPVKPVKSSAKSEEKSSGSSTKRAPANAEGSSKSKGSASKKQKVEKQSAPSKDKAGGKKQTGKSPAKASSKDQGKAKTSKKAKAEPTREEMHAVVVDILKKVDFNTATLSDIIRQLGAHFEVDLMGRKGEVKEIITEVISNMSDAEEAEENPEAGSDAEKDGDDDE